MFDVLVESTSRRRSARTWLLFFASSAVWLVVLTAVAIAGVMTYDARLDAEFDRVALTSVTPVEPPPAPPRQRTDVAPPSSGPSTRFESQPVQSPKIPDPPAVSRPPSVGAVDTHATGTGFGAGATGGDPNGSFSPGGSVGNGGTIATGAPPPPPEPERPAPAPQATGPQRVASSVLSGRAIRRAEPPYPTIAKQTHTSGDVIVEVVVSESGDVASARVVSGHPLLRDAALQAARNWRFTPTLLGGKPTKVVGTITFAFKL